MKQSTSQDKSSFWKNLDDDIDRIGRRVKENLQKYDRSPNIVAKPKITTRSYSQPKKVSSPIPAIQTNTSYAENRKRLLSIQKQEEQRAKLMKNRMSYMRNDQQKKYKTIQMAKKKFQHIVEVRNQSFREKSFIKKRRDSFIRQSKQEALEKVKSVKSARDSKSSTIENWKRTIDETAKKIRMESVNNESFIKERKMSFMTENQSKANHTRRDLEKSRSITSELSERKIQSSKQMKMQNLSNKAKEVNFQKKNNHELFKRLKAQTERISKWKSRAQRQIHEYRSFLGLQKPKTVNEIAPAPPSIDHKSSRHSQSRVKSNSFYLTNL